MDDAYEKWLLTREGKAQSEYIESHFDAVEPHDLLFFDPVSASFDPRCACVCGSPNLPRPTAPPRPLDQSH